MKTKWNLFIATIVTVISLTANAKTITVDSYNVDKKKNVFSSIQDALDDGNIQPGDTIIVLPGKYEPFVVSRSGSSQAPITIKSQTKQKALIFGSMHLDGRFASIHIEADNIVINGFKVLADGRRGQLERGIRISGTESSRIKNILVQNNLVKHAGFVGISASFADHVTIQDNEVTNTIEQHGVYIANSSDYPIVRNNFLHQNPYAGVHMNGDARLGGDGIISNAIIENNLIIGNGFAGSAAINMDGVINSVVRNNLVFNNKTHGIALFQEDGAHGSINNYILNNTIIMPPTSYHGLRIKNESTGNYVINNIILHLGTHDSFAVNSDSMKGLFSDFNIVTRIQTTDGQCCISLQEWQARHPSLDKHSKSVTDMSSLFANSQPDEYNLDFELSPSSPAIDSGMDLDKVTTDILGRPRPLGKRTDIGAYERKP